MKKTTAERIAKDPAKFAHHDRVFLNNPAVMQGMGLAPLVVLATSGQNAAMLAAAVALLLVPSRLLACLLSRLVPLREESPSAETLQKTLLPRALVYGFSTAIVYLAAYPVLNAVFGTSLLNLGIYLPMLTVEPLLTYRFGRVQETVRKAVIGRRALLPMAGMPAGGFIVLGVLCAVWRALAKKRRDYLEKEAHSVLAVDRQKEADGEQ